MSWYWPAEHPSVSQEVAPASDDCPLGQLSHDVAPVEDWYLPAAQIPHDDTPVLVALRPAGHAVQLDDPEEDA